MTTAVRTRGVLRVTRPAPGGRRPATIPGSAPAARAASAGRGGASAAVKARKDPRARAPKGGSWATPVARAQLAQPAHADPALAGRRTRAIASCAARWWPWRWLGAGGGGRSTTGARSARSGSGDTHFLAVFLALVAHQLEERCSGRAVRQRAVAPKSWLKASAPSSPSNGAAVHSAHARPCAGSRQRSPSGAAPAACAGGAGGSGAGSAAGAATGGPSAAAGAPLNGTPHSVSTDDISSPKGTSSKPPRPASAAGAAASPRPMKASCVNTAPDASGACMARERRPGLMRCHVSSAASSRPLAKRGRSAAEAGGARLAKGCRSRCAAGGALRGAAMRYPSRRTAAAAKEARPRLRRRLQQLLRRRMRARTTPRWALRPRRCLLRAGTTRSRRAAPGGAA